MRVEAQPAFVLHTRPWRETSLLVEAFSRDHGRVGLLARGVRRPHARLQRSTLEPLQALRVAWSGRGELRNLNAAEAVGNVHALHGERLLAALYVNELLVRLTARDDPYPQLFARYAALLDELEADAPIAWTLRRFERDLLAAIGYALRLDTAADTDDPIVADRDYDYLPGQGPVAASPDAGGVRISGRALLALAVDARPPGSGDQAALRRVMRAVLRVHLGERGLQSWRVLAEPARSG